MSVARGKYVFEEWFWLVLSKVAFDSLAELMWAINLVVLWWSPGKVASKHICWGVFWKPSSWEIFLCSFLKQNKQTPFLLCLRCQSQGTACLSGWPLLLSSLMKRVCASYHFPKPEEHSPEAMNLCSQVLPLRTMRKTQGWFWDKVHMK